MLSLVLITRSTLENLPKQWRSPSIPPPVSRTSPPAMAHSIINNMLESRDSGSVALRCLVVDDDHTLAEVLCAQLNAAGHRTRACFSETAARAYLLAHPVDLLVTDVCLSDSTEREGLDLLEWVRTLHPKAEVVVMSGYADGAMELRSRRSGGVRFFHKPVDPAILTGLADTLARKRLGSPALNSADQRAEWNDALAAELQRAYLMGEDAALDRLLVGFRPLVLSIARTWYGLDPDNARDVFQEISIELMLKISKARRLRPFIVGMTMNFSRSRRREGIRHRTLPLPPEPGPTTMVDDPGLHLDIHRLLAQLTPLERAVIESLYLEDKSYADTAHRLRLPIGSIGPTRNRALAAMRRFVTGPQR